MGGRCALPSSDLCVPPLPRNGRGAGGESSRRCPLWIRAASEEAPATAPTPSRAPALSEYVDALAGVYERTRAVQPAFETILDDVRRRLCRRLGLPAGATLLQLIQALPPDSPLRDALVEAHRALQNPQLTPDEALHLLRRIEMASQAN